MRWNHWLRVEVVWPLEALGSFCLIFFIRSHIYAWNMARGDWLKEIFDSTHSMVGWYVEVPDLVWFSYVNRSFFPLVFYEYMCLSLCGFNGCFFIDISLVICWL